MIQTYLLGGVAQLGERLPCKQEVRSSILLISTRDLGKLNRSRVSDTKKDLKEAQAELRKEPWKLQNERKVKSKISKKDEIKEKTIHRTYKSQDNIWTKVK